MTLTCPHLSTLDVLDGLDCTICVCGIVDDEGRPCGLPFNHRTVCEPVALEACS